MKERVLDVLMYLFDHCMDNEEEFYPSDQEGLVKELEAAGFSAKDIDRAFNWLEGIHDMQMPNEEEETKTRVPSFRVYESSELKKLNPESRGLLISLEQVGIVDELTREVILDRAMALDLEEIRLDHFKWITLMVLINRGNENSLEWLEEVIFNENTALLH